MADVELNSIGNGDGTNYLVRDNTKIPLSGSNQISGSLIPSTDNTYDLGSSSFNFNTIYCSHIKIRASENIACATNDSYFSLYGGTGYLYGASISLTGKDSSTQGRFTITTYNGTNGYSLIGFPNGTLTWNGQSIQTTSDARLKQQITQIDDDLLTAWEDVKPVQFKYNDAVETKSDNARLHTGYVVQQIDDACKSHNVDISKYGLYCHEEYAEETREVEHDDGTKTIEVVRPANEHYSLRYTEALIVECAYLRKKNKDLQEQLNALSERLEKLENR